MKVLIIEDEPTAARQLLSMLQALRAYAEVVGMIDTVEEALAFLRGAPPLDLIFLDIYLSDGISFAIFEALPTDTPVIFTTAYDQYAIRAFEVNSLDYLLKPIRQEELKKALDKYDRLAKPSEASRTGSLLAELNKIIQRENSYKRSFLVPHKDRLLPVAADAFAWFELRHEVVRGTTFDKQVLLMTEKSLEELAGLLPPELFYRANRQYLVSRKAIREVACHFNGRLYLDLVPPPAERVLVSKAKAGQFRDWLCQG